MIHRRILDVAASDPDASMEAIADEVSGASPGLVERVLDEYGDPGREDESTEGPGDADGSPNADGASGDASDLAGTDASGDESTAADGPATDDTGLVADESADDTELDGNTAEETETDGTTMDNGTSTDGGTRGLNVDTSADDAPVPDETTPSDEGAMDESGADGNSADGEVSTTDPGPSTSTPDREADTLTRGGIGSGGLAGNEETTTPDDGAPATDDEPDRPPDLDSLSDKQRRTLEALYERPNASQGDLAEDLDVTRATICRRLNAIPGFEWSDRRAFAESAFGDEDSAADDAGAAAIQSATPENDGGRGPTDDGNDRESTDSGDADRDGESARSAARSDAESGRTSDGDASGEAEASPGITDRRLAAVEDRLATIESRLDETGAGEGTDLSLSPELAHKVVHACMESDKLTEDEELEVLRSLMK